jgi:hypothetical protein
MVPFSAPTHNIKYVKKELLKLGKWIMPEAARVWQAESPKVLPKKIYYLFFLFFRHFVLKDLANMKYYKFFFKNYKLHVYSARHPRYFYLFYFMLFEHKNFELLDSFSAAYDKIVKIYFYNNVYTFFLLYIFNWDYAFFYHYDKTLYYNIKFTHTVFFFEDFAVKAEARYFTLYRHYFEHFRRFKYNEYLLTNKALYKYPLLKKILHAGTGQLRREFVRDFRKNIWFREHYAIHEFEEGVDVEGLFQHNLFHNEVVWEGLRSLLFLKFFKFFTKSTYLIPVGYFKPLLGTYLLHRAYHLYYLFNRRRVYWRYRFFNIVFVWVAILFYKIRFDFIEDFFDYFYRYHIKRHFKPFNLFNYGFLFHNYFLQSSLVKLLLQKHYLVHRILQAVAVESISALYGKHNWVLDIETDNQRKRRSLYVTKFFPKKKKYIKKKDLGKSELLLLKPRPSVKQVFASNKYPYIRFSTFAANQIYKQIWTVMLERSVFEFCDILSFYNDVSKSLTSALFNIKYIIEFFFWEAFHLYDKGEFVFLKRNVKALAGQIKVGLLITNYTCKFFATVLTLLSGLTQRQWVNRAFFYQFFKDFFFKIFLWYGDSSFFERLLKKHNSLLLNKFKPFHYKFFLWQLLNFFGKKRFLVYFNNNEGFYKD